MLINKLESYNIFNLAKQNKKTKKYSQQIASQIQSNT
jgi:hypothetical protein